MQIRYRRREAPPRTADENREEVKKRNLAPIPTTSLPALNPSPSPSPPPSSLPGLSRVETQEVKEKRGLGRPNVRLPPPPMRGSSSSASPFTPSLPVDGPSSFAPSATAGRRRASTAVHSAIPGGIAMKDHVRSTVSISSLLYQSYCFLAGLSLDTWLIFFGALLLFFSRHFLTLVMVLDAIRVMYWDVIKMWLLERDAVNADEETESPPAMGNATEETLREEWRSSGVTGDRQTHPHPGREEIFSKNTRTLGERPPLHYRVVASPLGKEDVSKEHKHLMETSSFKAERNLPAYPTPTPLRALHSSSPSSVMSRAGPSVLSAFGQRDRGEGGKKAGASSLSSLSTMRSTTLNSIPLVRVALMGSMTAATTLRWKWSQCLSIALSFSEFLERSYPVRQVFPSLFSTPFVANQVVCSALLDHAYFLIALGLSLWLLPFLCLLYSVMTGAQWLVHGLLRLLLHHELLAEDISSPLIRLLGEQEEEEEEPSDSDTSSSSLGDTKEKGKDQKAQAPLSRGDEEKHLSSLCPPPREHSSRGPTRRDSNSRSPSNPIATSTRSSSSTPFNFIPLRSFFSPVRKLPTSSDQKQATEQEKEEQERQVMANSQDRDQKNEEEKEGRGRRGIARRSMSRRRAQSKKSSSAHSCSARPLIQVLEATPSMASASTAATNLLLNAMKREKSDSYGSSSPFPKEESKEGKKTSKKGGRGRDGIGKGTKQVGETTPLQASTSVALPSYLELISYLYSPSSTFGEDGFHGDPDELCQMLVHLVVGMLTLFGVVWQLTHAGSGVPWIVFPVVLPLQILNELILSMT